MPVEELSPVPTKGNCGLTCFIQPSEMSELEAELKKRLKANARNTNNDSQATDHGGTDSLASECEDEDPDALIDAWRVVRSSCKAAMLRFVKNGGQGDVSAIPYSPSFCQYLTPDPDTNSKNVDVAVGTAENMNFSSVPTTFPYLFPSEEHLDLLIFTLRYSSMGKDFAGLISGWGIGAVLLDIVTYHSSILCGNGYDVAVDLNACSTIHDKNGNIEEGFQVEETEAKQENEDLLEEQGTTQHFISRFTELVSLQSNPPSRKGTTCDRCSAKESNSAREGNNVKIEENFGNHTSDDTTGEGGAEDSFTAATRQWLEAVAAFVAGCEKIIANCSGATAIALSDTSLFLVRRREESEELTKVEESATVTPNQDDSNGTTTTNDNISSGPKNSDPQIKSILPPLLPPRTEIRISYSDYSVSETGARLWGGGVALALFVAEKASILLAQNGDIVPVDDEKVTGKEIATASSQRRLFVELGAGVALPTCALIRSYMCAISRDGLLNEKKDFSGNHHRDNDKSETFQIQCVVTDVFESILKCAEKNVRRQLLPGSSQEREVSECKGEEKEKKKTSASATFRTEIVNFFEVEAYVQAQKAGNMLQEKDSHPNPTLEGTCDVILATDIVYDYMIGKAGIATLATMLRPCPMLSRNQSLLSLARRTVEGATNESKSRTNPDHDDSFSPCSFTSVDDVLLSWRDGRQCFAPKLGRHAEEKEKDEDQKQAQASGYATSKANKEERKVSRGGIALICCESHRDAMPQIYDFFRDNGLVVLWHEKDCQNALRYYTIPEGVTISSCELFLVAKAGYWP